MAPTSDRSAVVAVSRSVSAPPERLHLALAYLGLLAGQLTMLVLLRAG